MKIQSLPKARLIEKTCEFTLVTSLCLFFIIALSTSINNWWLLVDLGISLISIICGIWAFRHREILEVIEETKHTPE